MKRLLTSLSLGVGATRHLIWYLSYQISRETREAAATSSDRRTSEDRVVE
jgi:hypothetical protein